MVRLFIATGLLAASLLAACSYGPNVAPQPGAGVPSLGAITGGPALGSAP